MALYQMVRHVLVVNVRITVIDPSRITHRVVDVMIMIILMNEHYLLCFGDDVGLWRLAEWRFPFPQGRSTRIHIKNQVTCLHRTTRNPRVDNITSLCSSWKMILWSFTGASEASFALIS